VTYRISAPDGTCDNVDNGLYTIQFGIGGSLAEAASIISDWQLCLTALADITAWKSGFSTL